MSKELEMLKDLIVEFDEMGYEPSITLCPNRIEEINSFRRRLKNVLLTFQEQEKVLNNIKEKIIWVENDKLMCGRYADTEIELEEEDFENKEEFNLLKRYF